MRFVDRKAQMPLVTCILHSTMPALEIRKLIYNCDEHLVPFSEIEVKGVVAGKRAKGKKKEVDK